MKKKLAIILIMLFASFFLCSCNRNNEERTFVADGTYVAWRLSTSSTNLLNADGVGNFNFKNNNEYITKKVNSPTLITVKVSISNDKIVMYYIDEIQSIAKVNYKRGTTDVNIDENGNVLGVTWVFNSKSKKELGYEYNMGGVNGNTYGSCNENGICKEWFLQVSELERFWLKNSPLDYTIKKEENTTKDDLLAGVTISVGVYEELAKEAINNAKNGKVKAITVFEHYTYDVTYVTADIKENGLLENIKLNAQIFGAFKDGNENINAYDSTSEDYLVFGWNSKDKYSSYGEMSNGNTWQSMIDKINNYINENGWDGSLTPGRIINDKLVNKGVTKNGKEIEILSTVTIQLNNEVKVMNDLLNYFPNGFGALTDDE